MLILPRNGTPEHLAAVLYCAFADAVEWKYSEIDLDMAARGGEST